MRAVIQRVSRAQVEVVDENGSRRTSGSIGGGVVVLLGVGADDTERDARYLADKIAGLRLFSDDAGKMNLALGEVGGAVLLVSQFTLYGDCRNGRRPSYTQAAPPDTAQALYAQVAELLRGHGLTVATGEFQTHMQVDLCNDGPVTLLIDSQKQF